MPKPATTEENRKIREAGTEGEWYVPEHYSPCSLKPVCVDEPGGIWSKACNDATADDATLIAHAVNQLIPLSEERDYWRTRCESTSKAALALDLANRLDSVLDALGDAGWVEDDESAEGFIRRKMR